jgi:hypothetical protein
MEFLIIISMMKTIALSHSMADILLFILNAQLMFTYVFDAVISEKLSTDFRMKVI